MMSMLFVYVYIKFDILLLSTLLAISSNFLECFRRWKVENEWAMGGVRAATPFTHPLNTDHESDIHTIPNLRNFVYAPPTKKIMADGWSQIANVIKLIFFFNITNLSIFEYVGMGEMCK